MSFIYDPKNSTRPTNKPQSSPQRTLWHPNDKRGELLDRLGQNSRGVNTADPEVEDPAVTFPDSFNVGQYRDDGMPKLKMGEGGTGKSQA